MFRSSASLILLYKKPKIVHGDFDFNVLMFERTKNMSFMPNSYVFPGGTEEGTDLFPLWSEYYKQFDSYNSNIFNNEKFDKREISLRITAVRETFEETGILLCRRKDQGNPENSGFSNYIEGFVTEDWQKRVHDDSNQFMNICKQYQLIPDIWNLYLWSCWITPSTFKKRFKTTFFLAALEDEPNVTMEVTEGINYLWKSPVFFLNEFRENRLCLPVPQLYELTRLATQKRIDCIKDFARKRQLIETTTFFPIQYKCTNGVVGVLTGDDYYPKDPFKQQGYIHTNVTVEEFRLITGKIHRISYVGENKAEIQLNFKPLDGHLAPINSEEK